MPVTKVIEDSSGSFDKKELKDLLEKLLLRNALMETVKHANLTDAAAKPGDVFRYIYDDVLERRSLFSKDAKLEKYRIVPEAELKK